MTPTSKSFQGMRSRNIFSPQPMSRPGKSCRQCYRYLRRNICHILRPIHHFCQSFLRKRRSFECDFHKLCIFGFLGYWSPFTTVSDTIPYVAGPKELPFEGTTPMCKISLCHRHICALEELTMPDLRV